jgi:O-antigen/teichoic acid export membrane protein
MTLGRKLFKNIASNYIGVVGQILIAFFLSPFLVHTLGDTRYGIWTVVASLTGYLSILDLGIGAALTRFIARYYQQNDFDKINRILSSGLVIFCLIGGVIITLSPLISWGMTALFSFDEKYLKTVQILIIIVSFDMAVFVIAGTFRGVLAGFQRFEVINIARLFALVFKAIAFYIFLSDGYGLLAMGFLSLAANSMIVLISVIFIKVYYPTVKFKHSTVNKKSVNEIFHFSKFVFISMLAFQVLFYSDSFIIGYFLGMSAITYYSIPWSLTLYAQQICLSVSRSYIPAFSELDSEGNQDKIRFYYISGTRVILFISNLFFGGMIVLGAPFISIWMGSKYAVQAEPLIITFFITLYFLSPNFISYAYLQGCNNHKFYAYLSMLVALLNVILSIFLIEKMGLIGVAIGAAIPQILIFGFFIPIYVSKSLKLSYFEFLRSTHFNLLVPTIFLVVSLYMMKMIFIPQEFFVLFLQGSVGAFLYVISVYFISLNHDERDKIKNIGLVQRLLSNKNN